MYRLNIENFLKYTLVTVTKSISRSRCRRQEVFADLQKAAAVGRKFSQTFKKPLPSAGGFRKPSKSRCRWQEVFADLQKAAAAGRKSSSSDSDLTRLLLYYLLLNRWSLKACNARCLSEAFTNSETL